MIPLNLRILLVILSIILVIVICRLISNKKLPIKYSLFWLLAAFVILLVGLFPNFVGFFTNKLGFATTSNMIVGILIGVLFIITLLLTIIISNLKKKIVMLIQEISILKSEKK